MEMHDVHHVSHAWNGLNNLLSHRLSTAPNDYIDLGNPYAPVNTGF